MDSEDAILNNALGALRDQFGGGLRGSMSGGQVEMRRVLQQRLGLDEPTADRVVKKLAQTGRLTWQGRGGVPDEAGDTATGPVATVVGSTQAQGSGPLIAPLASVAQLAAVNNASGTGVGGSTTGAAAAAMAGSAFGPAVEDAGEPLGAGDVAQRAQENREGATMGQLGDTNVEDAPSGPRTVGQAQELEEDDTQGAWTIS